MFKYDEKGYLSQFVSEMFDSLQKDSTKCAPQFQLNSFVTMATYSLLVPDLPNIKGISGHLWHSIFIFANGGSYTVYMIQQAYKYVSVSLWPCLTFFGLKITYILKSSG